MKQIIFDADSVWHYHHGNKHILVDNILLIAKNEEFGAEVYLSSDGQYPQFSVIVDDSLQYSDFAMSIEDCRSILNEIYEEYLTENLIQKTIISEIDESSKHDTGSNEEEFEEIDEEVDEEDIVEIIKSREGVLVATMLDFLIEVMDSDDAVSEPKFWDNLQDCLEHTLKYIADKGFPVYRPMLIKDEETQKISLVDFPYKDYDITL